MTAHLTEDDLVLHFYGEMETAADAAAAAHLAGCETCRRSYRHLQQVLAAVDAAPVPALPESFERTVWARLEPALPARRSWVTWVLAPANLAWAAAVVVLVAAAFFAGRLSGPAGSPGGSASASAEDIRERILLSDLEEHLERSQMMLVELVSAEEPASREPLDFSAERERAEDLVAANRLYRQATTATGDVAVSQLLDELERLLVELAASPDQLGPDDAGRVQQQITARDLLFKVRVVSAGVRARQEQQIRQRTGAGQSS